MTEQTKGEHPAVFTDSIIEALGVLIPETIPDWFIIHDPFAGEGIKLATLCEKMGYVFSGTDLENWVGKDSRVLVGDATDPRSYPEVPFAVVTSPTYNNGVNDHFNSQDDSERLTYRSRAGHELHLNNTGRWSGRGSKKAESEYWRLTNRAIRYWPIYVIVNVKDSIRNGEVYPLVDMWKDLLSKRGYSVADHTVDCPGWRYGSNNNLRVETESILVGIRSK